MAKFRMISPQIWNDAKFRALSDSGKLVFLMLLTHPHTSAIGTLREYFQGLAAELGWTDKAFREAFREAFQKGMVKADEKAGLIWLPNFIKYNPPLNPNVLKSWVGAFNDCPECDLKNEAFQNVKRLIESLSKAFREAFREAFRDPLPNQEQEQEQEQDIKILSHTNNHNTSKNNLRSEVEKRVERENFKDNLEFDDNPSIEFVELRDFYDRIARPEGSHAGWIEFKRVKKGAPYFPGIHFLMDDISKRIDGGFWDKGFEPGLAKYLLDRTWEQEVTSRQRDKPKSFKELEEDRKRKQKEETLKRLKAMQDGEKDGL